MLNPINPRATFSPRDTAMPGKGWLIAAVALLLGAAAGWAAPVPAELSLKWILAVSGLAGLSLLLLVTRGFRPLLLTGLALTIPLELNIHLIYREGQVGVADGIMVEGIDVWLVLLLGMFLWRLMHDQPLQFSWFPYYSLTLLVLLGCDVLSCWNSVDQQLSLFGFIEHLHEFLLFLVLANSLREKEDFLGLFRGLAVGLFVVGTICVVEMALQTRFIGRGIIDESELAEGVFRAGGFSTPTWTGGYLASLLPLVLACFLAARKPLVRVVLFIALGAGCAGMLCTLTRSAMLVAPIGIATTLFCLRGIVRIRPAHIVATAALAAILVGVFWKEIAVRVDEGSGNAIARMSLLETAGNMASYAPFAGIGVNTYALRMDEFRTATPLHEFSYIVHSKYALLLAETGVFSLLAFLVLLAKAFVDALRLRHAPPGFVVGGAAALGSLVVLAILMNLESYDAGPAIFHVFTLIAVIAALARLNGPNAPRSSQASSRTTSYRTGLGATGPCVETSLHAAG